MRKPILLCYDGTSGARRAIEWACSFPPGRMSVVLHLWTARRSAVCSPRPQEMRRTRRERAVAIADEGVALARAGRPSATTTGRRDRRELAVDPPGCRGRAGADDRARRPRSRRSCGRARVGVAGRRAPRADSGRHRAAREGMTRWRMRTRLPPPARSLRASRASPGHGRWTPFARYVISEAGRGRGPAHRSSMTPSCATGSRCPFSRSCSIGRTSSMLWGATRSPTCRAGSPRPYDGLRCRAAPAEDREQQQEDVQDVEEDRCREQRRGSDVLRLAQPLEVVHREAREDHEAEDRVDQLTVRDADEDQTIPNTISAISAKNMMRASDERSRRVA